MALVRELLDQASLSTNSTLLALSSNRLYQSLGGLLNGASSCDLTREPIPVWNLARILRAMPRRRTCEADNHIDGWQWWSFDQYAMCANANA